MTLEIFPLLQVWRQNFCDLRAPTIVERQGASWNKGREGDDCMRNSEFFQCF